MRIVIFGLSITSSWGNGHATTYRGLMRELVARGHDVLFLERDVPWYREHRDLPRPPYGRTELYSSLPELMHRFTLAVKAADLTIIGSYVPDGVKIGEWIVDTALRLTAFYDIDTPVTLAKLDRGDEEYLSSELIPRFDLYLSFTGGPTLRILERDYGAKRARALYCSVDPTLHRPRRTELRWDLGYLGTYSPDRQPPLERLLIEPARSIAEQRFVVGGPSYPDGIEWPVNVERISHVPPPEHDAFYASQRFALNITRADMLRAGFSPSVRLFEAAACGAPIISDDWPGLETFFEPDREIFVAKESSDVARLLRELPEHERLAAAERARSNVLANHTAARRAAQLEEYLS